MGRRDGAAMPASGHWLRHHVEYGWGCAAMVRKRLEGDGFSVSFSDREVTLGAVWRAAQTFARYAGVS